MFQGNVPLLSGWYRQGIREGVIPCWELASQLENRMLSQSSAAVHPPVCPRSTVLWCKRILGKRAGKDLQAAASQLKGTKVWLHIY